MASRGQDNRKKASVPGSEDLNKALVKAFIEQLKNERTDGKKITLTLEEGIVLLGNHNWDFDVAAEVYRTQQTALNSFARQTTHQQQPSFVNRPPSTHPFQGMQGLSVKGIPGFNQIPHPLDPRPVSRKALAGTFLLPAASTLTQDQQGQVNSIISQRQNPARGGKSVKSYPRKGPAKSSTLPAAMQVAKTRRRSKTPILSQPIRPANPIRGRQASKMPTYVDPRNENCGNGNRFGFRAKRRRGSARRGKSKKGRGGHHINYEWEDEYLQAKLTACREGKANKADLREPHRYICYMVGCGVNANNAREISRHFNWSDPPIHPGFTHNPSRVIKEVYYSDWLLDDDLYATKYATTTQEFYETLRIDKPLSDEEDDEGVMWLDGDDEDADMGEEWEEEGEEESEAGDDD